jgi:hypothetical protein
VKIIKDIKLDRGNFNETIQIKLVLPPYQGEKHSQRMIKNLRRGVLVEEMDLFTLFVKEDFFKRFCGIDQLPSLRVVPSVDEEIVEVTNNRDFIKFYTTNFDEFTSNKKKRKKKKKKEEGGERGGGGTQDIGKYFLFYFANDKSKVFIHSDALNEFNEFVSSRVMRNFKYQDVEKVRLLAFTPKQRFNPSRDVVGKWDSKNTDAKRNKKIQQNPRLIHTSPPPPPLPQKFSNLLSIKMSYFEFYEDLYRPEKKLFKVC